MNNKAELRMEIENLRFHLDTLCIIEDATIDPLLRMEIKTEIRMCLKRIRILKDALLDIYLMEIKNTYPQADAVYEDKIIKIVGEGTLCNLVSKRKIQLCGCINGRRLYAL